MERIKKLSSNRAITLIALIITIIILLILATITVDVAIDDGLFTKAQEAVDKTNDKVENTQNRVDELTGILDDLEEKPKIGDYVNYSPEINNKEVDTDQSGHSEVQNFETQTGENSLRWRIMSLGDEDGNILLVADRPTTAKLTLNGEAGYTNATTLIEGICSELYDDQTLGATARSYNYYSQVLSDVSEGTLNIYIEGGDRFPYLVNEEIWIPVSTYDINSISDYSGYVLSYNAENGYHENYIYNSYSVGNSMATYSLLPVVTLPKNYELIYSGSDSSWNVWNPQKIE